MRKELLCVLGGLMAACAVQAQQGQADYTQQPYYQGGLQAVQMAPGAGYGSYYYPNNYGYTPSYPANYGYGAAYGYGNGAGVPNAGYGYATGVPNTVQVPADIPAAPAAGNAIPAGDPVSGGGVSGGPNKTFWVSADYLLSSIQRGQLRYPLVTTGSANDTLPGALGQPNTAVVFGANNLSTGLSSGVRGEIGAFLDADHVFSLDGGGFILFPRNVHATFASDGNGFPTVARPYINTLGGQLRAEQSAYNPFFFGSTSVNTDTKLYGFEANARCNGSLGTNWKADFLVGFRFLQLDESLNINDTLTPIPPPNGINVLTFLGPLIDPAATLSDRDSFATSNTFYGVNLGGRLRWEYDWLTVTAFGKVALGATEQHVRINGSTTLVGPAGTQVATGGILALPSNIGSYSRSVFGVVPETGITIGMQPINHVRLSLGYSLLYWNAVVRPGDQIDPRLNRSAIPGDPTFGSAMNPGSNPTFTFQDRSFRVQNLTAGVEIYY